MGKTVLIVDDDENIVEVLSDALRNEGFVVVSAGDGEQGIARALTDRPDIIISDIIMPKVDGWELCQTLRGLPSTKATPFLFLTSLNQKPEKIMAKRLGADDYLTKPFDMNSLLERVHRLSARVRERNDLLAGNEKEVHRGGFVNILVDTIEFIKAMGRTGVIAVTTGHTKGLVYIEEGILKHAVYANRRGEDALYAMLRLPESQVSFKENRYPDLPSNFTLSWNEFMESLTDQRG